MQLKTLLTFALVCTLAAAAPQSQSTKSPELDQLLCSAVNARAVPSAVAIVASGTA